MRFSGIQAAFDQARAAGVLPSALHDAIVSPGVGFYIIIIGTALISLAGLITLIGEEATPQWRET